MKKVIGIALVLLLGCSMMAFADANNWLVYVNASNQDSVNGTDAVLGYYDGYTNGIDTDAGEFAEPNTPPQGMDLATAALWLDSSSASLFDFRQPLATDPTTKVFVLSTYYQRNATAAADYITAINVKLTQDDTNPFDYGFGPAGYKMTLEYKDAQGAIKTEVFNADNPLTTFSWAARVKTEKSFDDWDAKLTVEKVPEPGSMLALGSGLVGLMGFALRRRS